jgi:hypothetical protein
MKSTGGGLNFIKNLKEKANENKEKDRFTEEDRKEIPEPVELRKYRIIYLTLNFAFFFFIFFNFILAANFYSDIVNIYSDS